jgi:hypothetical protein
MTPTTDTAGQILKQDSLGRVRTPAEQREALLSEFERSGMSGTAFAAFAGIKYTTFANWVQSKRKRSGARMAALPEGGARSGQAVRWVEASVEAAGTAPGADGSLVVEFCRGARMAVGDSRQAALAAELLRHWEAGKRC